MDFAQMWPGNGFHRGTPKVECNSARFFPKFVTDRRRLGKGLAGICRTGCGLTVFVARMRLRPDGPATALSRTDAKKGIGGLYEIKRPFLAPARRG